MSHEIIIYIIYTRVALGNQQQFSVNSSDVPQEIRLWMGSKNRIVRSLPNIYLQKRAERSGSEPLDTSEKDPC